MCSLTYSFNSTTCSTSCSFLPSSSVLRMKALRSSFLHSFLRGRFESGWWGDLAPARREPGPAGHTWGRQLKGGEPQRVNTAERRVLKLMRKQQETFRRAARGCYFMLDTEGFSTSLFISSKKWGQQRALYPPACQGNWSRCEEALRSLVLKRRGRRWGFVVSTSKN